MGWSNTKNAANSQQMSIVAAILASAMDLRGGDSWGVAYLNSGSLKRGVGQAAYNLSARKLGKATRVIGHTRKATTGSVTIENSHPFRITGEKHTVVGAHNGIVFNHHELNRKHGRTFAVDSMHLFGHIADGLSLDEVEAYGALTYEIDGDSNIYLGRFNGGELAIYGIGASVDDVRGIIWASTDQCIIKAAALAGLSVFSYRVDANKLYYIQDDKLFVSGSDISCESRYSHYYGGCSGADYGYGTGGGTKRTGSSSTGNFNQKVIRGLLTGDDEKNTEDKYSISNSAKDQEIKIIVPCDHCGDDIAKKAHGRHAVVGEELLCEACAMVVGIEFIPVQDSVSDDKESTDNENTFIGPLDATIANVDSSDESIHAAGDDDEISIPMICDICDSPIKDNNYDYVDTTRACGDCISGGRIEELSQLRDEITKCESCEQTFVGDPVIKFGNILCDDCAKWYNAPVGNEDKTIRKNGIVTQSCQGCGEEIDDYELCLIDDMVKKGDKLLVCAVCVYDSTQGVAVTKLDVATLNTAAIASTEVKITGSQQAAGFIGGSNIQPEQGKEQEQDTEQSAISATAV